MTTLRKILKRIEGACGLPAPMVFLALALTLLAPRAAPAANTWTATGDLNIGRDGHTATLLANGKVLVAGGYGHDDDDGRYLQDTELYNPALGTWDFTGLLPGARSRHTATRLGNGHVLVVGGTDGVNFLTNAQLYDPASGTWPSAGNEASLARIGHTATLLANGWVLVAGGFDGNNCLASAKIYNGSYWFAADSLKTARQKHTATLLLNGKVLVVGGEATPDGALLNTAELYDPAAGFGGTWSTTGLLNIGRLDHTATLLPNGKVLVAGRDSAIESETRSAELYDPAKGTWSNTGSMNQGHASHTATRLSNGQVLVAGSFLGNSTSAELYDPAKGTWSNTGSLNDGRRSHTATRLRNGQVLVAGGDADYPSMASAELYKPASVPIGAIDLLFLSD